MNLVKNALKFTPGNGKITIKSSYDVNTAFLKVSVKDTGIGIEPDDLDRLFKNFSTLKTSQQVNSQGIGLGLAISKALVEANAGKIHVESEGRGKGSTFTFELKMACTHLDESYYESNTRDISRELKYSSGIEQSSQRSSISPHF